MSKSKNLEIATLAGGCFWCMESTFAEVDGVEDVVSGYAGGNVMYPDYETVACGRTDHREAVQILFDPEKITYEEILNIFWQHIDPTDRGGEFVDRGFQYTSEIFVHDSEQRSTAERSKRELMRSGKFSAEVITPIISYRNFYPAEDYHQDYFRKEPFKYEFYRSRSGRDEFLSRVWGQECPISG